MRKLLAVLIFVVAGCASNGSSPQQAVFAAKGAYEVALTTAVAYKALPVCAPATRPVCSDPAIVAQLQRAQPAVRAALDAAEGAVRDPKFGWNAADTAVIAAQASLNAFVAITSTLRTK